MAEDIETKFVILKTNSQTKKSLLTLNNAFKRILLSSNTLKFCKIGLEKQGVYYLYYNIIILKKQEKILFF